MNNAKLLAKMHAEGIVLFEVKDAIIRVGNEMKTRGTCGPIKELDIKSPEQLLKILGNTTRYGGGYMYQGDVVLVDGIDFGAAYYKTLRVNRHDEDYPERVKALFHEKTATILEVVSYMSESESNRWIKTPDGDWAHLGTWSSMWESWENSVPYLPSGIRKKVAEAVGADPESSVFHSAFNLAVEILRRG